MNVRGLTYLALLTGAVLAMAFPALVETTTVVEKARMVIKLVALASAALYLYRASGQDAKDRPLPGGALALVAVCLGVLSLWLPGASFFSLLLIPVAVALILPSPVERQFWLTLLSLGFLAAFPVELLEQALEDLLGYSVIIAKTSGFLLYYFGYELRVTGDTIVTQQGALQVVGACSGLKMMLLLAVLVLCYGLVMGLKPRPWLQLAGWALLTGLVVSIVRVDLIVFCIDTPKWFHFFHEGAGSELFTITALLGTAILGRHQIEPPLLRMLQEKKPEASLSTKQLLAFLIPAGLGLLGGVGVLLV